MYVPWLAENGKLGALPDEAEVTVEALNVYAPDPVPAVDAAEETDLGKYLQTSSIRTGEHPPT